MKVETNKLKTIHNFSKQLDKPVTETYIYRMINEGRLVSVIIDGIKFIDTSKTPKILPLKTK